MRKAHCIRIYNQTWGVDGMELQILEKRRSRGSEDKRGKVFQTELWLDKDKVLLESYLTTCYQSTWYSE